MDGKACTSFLSLAAIASLNWFIRKFSAGCAIGLGLLLALGGVQPYFSVPPFFGGWAEFFCGVCAFAALSARLTGKIPWPWLGLIAVLGGMGWLEVGFSSTVLLAAIF